MGWSVKKDENYDATKGGNDPYRPFAPLEAGSVVLSVYEVKQGEYKNGGNAGRPHARIQFKVTEGQKGANKRLFQTVGIFEKWAPTAKNPDGFDNFTFFNFFAAATGKKETDFRGWFKETAEPFGELPGPGELEGRKVVGVLKIVPDTFAYEKALAAFREDEDLKAAVDSEELREAFTAKTGYTAEDYKGNDIASFKVYDGTIPSAGAANTASPKIAAVEL